MSVYPIVGDMNGNWQAAQAAYNRALAASYQANLGAGTLPFGALLPYGPGSQAVSPPEPIEDAGISAGEIVGWRAWWVVGGFLRSMMWETVWPHDEPLEARSAVEDHQAGGIYAFKTQTDALSSYVDHFSHRLQVVGRVHLWGAVIEHEHGYRAQFARVISVDHLIGDGGQWFRKRRLRKLRSAYGVA